MSLQSIDLRGKTALVTGASKGIGLATAYKLSEYGASVVLAARSARIVENQAKQMIKSGAKAVGVACDVTRFCDVEAAVQASLTTFGRLDILVNNAGTIDPISRIEDSAPGDWSVAVDTNIKGVYHGLRAAIPVMRASRAGVIVNLSSGAANSALEGFSHYCCTKAAAKKLTECAHTEVGGLGIRVIGLSPGTVSTGMQAQIKSTGVGPISRLDWSAHIPAEWAAEAVVFLCSDEAASFAGQDFSIKTRDGRRLVGLPMDGATD